MNKKSIGALLLSAALLVGGTGATFAYFTDYAQSNQQILTLGNVDVNFKDNSGTEWGVVARHSDKVTALQALSTFDGATFNQLFWRNSISNNDEIFTGDKNQIYYLAPGDVVAKSFTVKNNGTLDAKIKLSVEGLTVKDAGGGTITNTFTVSPNNYLIKAYHVSTQGGAGEEIQLDLYTENNGQGNFVLDAMPGEEVVVYAVVALDESINNTLQGGNVTFNLRADATQWNNNGWNEAGN